jgi:hypothetical protein
MKNSIATNAAKSQGSGRLVWGKRSLAAVADKTYPADAEDTTL